jgi:hypothetical protein
MTRAESAERVKAIGEQFRAERAVFATFVAAIRGADVPGLVGSPAETPPEPGCNPEPAGVEPGRHWFWFAGSYYRVRHSFDTLGPGRYASAIVLDTPHAGDAEKLHPASLRFDRRGAVEWFDGSSGGRLLDADPLAALWHLILCEMPRAPDAETLDSLAPPAGCGTKTTPASG